MCERSVELGWNQYRKTVFMYLRTEKNTINTSETLAKKEAHVYSAGVLFRRLQENLLLYSENMEGNSIIMNLICIGILISLSDEKTLIKKCAVRPLLP